MKGVKYNGPYVLNLHTSCHTRLQQKGKELFGKNNNEKKNQNINLYLFFLFVVAQKTQLLTIVTENVNHKTTSSQTSPLLLLPPTEEVNSMASACAPTHSDSSI